MLHLRLHKNSNTLNLHEIRDSLTIWHVSVYQHHLDLVTYLGLCAFFGPMQIPILYSQNIQDLSYLHI